MTIDSYAKVEWNLRRWTQLKSNTKIIVVIHFFVRDWGHAISVSEYNVGQSANFGCNYSGLKSKYSCKSVVDCCRQRSEDILHWRQGGSWNLNRMILLTNSCR